METNFKESSIPQSYSRALATTNLLLNAPSVHMVTKAIFMGISKYIGAKKDMTIPQAIGFKKANGEFLVAAKVEYIKNEDNPDDTSAGQWNYSWTTDQNDISDCNVEYIGETSGIIPYLVTAAQNFGFYYRDSATASYMTNLLIEMIMDFVKENAKDGDEAVLTFNGIFKAVGTVENGEIVLALIPGENIKVLIKDDSAIQEK